MWSVVVSQPSTPGRSAQIRSRRSLAARGSGASTAVSAGSPGRRRARRPRAPSSGEVGHRVARLRRAAGRAIQRASCARLVRDRQRGERARASATCVRSGPTVPRGGVPRIVWQPAQACARKTAARAAARAVRRRAAASAPASRATRGTRPAARRRPRAPCARAAARRTRSTGRGSGPAGRRRAAPGCAAPGSGRSSGSAPAPRSCGSRRRSCRRRSTRVPTGMWISFAVTAPRARVAHLPEPLVADHLDRQRGRARARRRGRAHHEDVGADEQRESTTIGTTTPSTTTSRVAVRSLVRRTAARAGCGAHQPSKSSTHDRAEADRGADRASPTRAARSRAPRRSPGRARSARRRQARASNIRPRRVVRSADDFVSERDVRRFATQPVGSGLPRCQIRKTQTPARSGSVGGGRPGRMIGREPDGATYRSPCRASSAARGGRFWFAGRPVPDTCRNGNLVCPAGHEEHLDGRGRSGVGRRRPRFRSFG